MDMELFTQIMVMVTPALTAAIAIIGGVTKIISLVKDFKVSATKDLEEKTSKMSKSFDDIAKINARLESMEKFLLEEKERKK